MSGQPGDPASHSVALFESFAARRFGGNPAGVVVLESTIDPEEMLGLAAAINAPTTGFVLRSECSPSAARVRFFTPTQEIDACGHVTIAVAQFLHDLGIWSGPEPTVVSCAGGQQTITPNRLGFSMRQTARPSIEPSVDRDSVSDCLGIPVRSLMSASTGLRHLFVEVDEMDDLGKVTASHEDLSALGATCGVDTIGVFAHLGDGRIRLRDFTAPIGVMEEPASGTTAGALAIALGASDLVVEQGVEIGRPSELHVTSNGSTVDVSGATRRVLRGTLDDQLD